MRIVFDSSALISVSQTCLINILGGLHKKIDAQFFIPEAVFYEAVERPISIKRFELNAIRIKKAVDENWFTVAKVEKNQLFNEIDHVSNNCFFVGNKPIKLLQLGEIEALALIKQLGADGFAIDERTTRMLIESPEHLRKILQARRRVRIEINKKNAGVLGKMFQQLSIVRSVELIALAFEQGLLAKELPSGRQSLEAALFAAKYSGCAVSSREINMFLHAGKLKTQGG